jgi:hypothetical protein
LSINTKAYKALLNSFHKRLAYLAGKKIIKLADYAKAEKISYSNLLNKANRQTIEAFLFLYNRRCK